MSYTIKVINGKQRYYDVTCDGCNDRLLSATPVLVHEDGGWPCLQPDDALTLNLSGGYGEAIDPFGYAAEDDLRIVLCNKCTIRMCDEWPAIKKIVQQHCSPSLGHHCSRSKQFEWSSAYDCCRVFCSKCGRNATTLFFNGRYERRTAKCFCGVTALGIWKWEATVSYWVGDGDIFNGPMTKENAEKALSDLISAGNENAYLEERINVCSDDSIVT